MRKAIPYKSKQFLSLLIKLSIVFGAGYFIYFRLTHNEKLDFEIFWEILQSKQLISPLNISLLIFLTTLNWLFEVLKWQLIVSPIKKIHFTQALQQSLGALTASLFTPNRIGEYGAKAIYFEKKYRKKIIVLTLINNLSQLLTTLFFGSIGFFIFISSYSIDLSYAKFYRWIALIAVVIASFLIFSWKMKKIKIQGVSIHRLKSFLKTISINIRFKVLGFAFLRYLIFSHQFYFLLVIFSPETDYLILMSGITTVYLLSSVIPMLFIFDVIVKGSIAVWVFGFSGLNELSVLVITMLMWLLNFVIPSIFGSYFILNFKTFNEVEKL